ncbi:MAG: heavy-metal-associated domain-containing protein [Gelidibacter sp.]|nr:heavy-metal-associated domain-containing protein [Gelidibacter sp.]
MTLKNIGLVAVASLFIMACKNDSKPEIKTVETEVTAEAHTLDPNAKYAKAEFSIEGMTCAMGCAKTIEKKIAKMDGVKSATVDFDKQLAMVEYDEAKVTPTSLEETVKKTGDMYSVKDMKTVDAFSTEKHECKADCKMACCADKAEKTMAEKKECKADCKMACCAKKEKA